MIHAILHAYYGTKYDDVLGFVMCILVGVMLMGTRWAEAVWWAFNGAYCWVTSGVVFLAAFLRQDHTVMAWHGTQVLIGLAMMSYGWRKMPKPWRDRSAVKTTSRIRDIVVEGEVVDDHDVEVVLKELDSLNRLPHYIYGSLNAGQAVCREKGFHAWIEPDAPDTVCRQCGCRRILTA